TGQRSEVESGETPQHGRVRDESDRAEGLGGAAGDVFSRGRRVAGGAGGRRRAGRNDHGRRRRSGRYRRADHAGLRERPSRHRGGCGAAAKGTGGARVAKSGGAPPPSMTVVDERPGLAGALPVVSPYRRRSKSMSVCELVSLEPRVMATSASITTTRMAAAMS